MAALIVSRSTVLRPGSMPVTKAFLLVALLSGVIGIAFLRCAAAGPAPTNPAQALFVANSFDVTAYPAGARGNISPVALTTDMISPSGIARDASGKIYVLNNDEVSEGFTYFLVSSVFVYPPLAISTGTLNEAPIAAVSLMDYSSAMTVDSAGNIYVTNQFGGPAVSGTEDSGSVTVDPAGTNGSAAPLANVSGALTGLAHPVGIALDLSGNIYVANSGTANTSSAAKNQPSVTVYSAGSNGNVPPKAIIAGSNLGSYVNAIALDSSWNLYAAAFQSAAGWGVEVFPAGSDGDAPSVATITGTGLYEPAGLTLDPGGNIYVSNEEGGISGDGSIIVFPAGGNGDVTPLATITSNSTGIVEASAIAVDSHGNIYVANELGGPEQLGSVTVYSAGSYAVTAPIATIVGANTGLNYPIRIAVDRGGNIFVLNSDNSITVYPANSTGDVTPIATIKPYRAKQFSDRCSIRSEREVLCNQSLDW
jgi:hypothetical protein